MWYLVYIVAHLLVYLLVLRRRPAFRRERTIFLYHALSAVAVTAAVVAGVFLAGPQADLYAAIAIVALHGIYSVSFLEVWSLAEGGYSLQIVEHLAQADRAGQPADMEMLRAIGVTKQESRLDGLARVGLVRQAGNMVELTPAGRLVASVFAFLAWLTHASDGV